MPRQGAIVAVLAIAGLASSFMFTLVVPIQSKLPELLDASREDTAWVVTSTLLAAHMETYSEGAELCRVRAGGTKIRIEDDVQKFREAARFEMLGKPTYRMAAQYLPGYLQRLMERAGTGMRALDKLVPHQASAKALDHLERALEMPKDFMVRILATHGNQMAASIPTAPGRSRSRPSSRPTSWPPSPTWPGPPASWRRPDRGRRGC